jgi:hypothetical protein
MHAGHPRRRRFAALVAVACLAGGAAATLGAGGASATDGSTSSSSPSTPGSTPGSTPASTPDSTPGSTTPTSSSPDTSVPTSVAPASVSTVTLPLFGAPLTIDLMTGPGGALSSVTINPADGWTAPQVKPNRVAFVNDDGTAKVVVRSREGGGQRIDAKAGTLADLVGPGRWTGDVFGNGVTTTVDFSIADRGDGTPDIVGIGVTGASGIVGPVRYDDDLDDWHDKSSAKVTITFTESAPNATLTRQLTIKATVEIGDDDDGGDTEAKVRISLSKIKQSAPDQPVAAGPGSWTGVLCDGTTATVAYVLSDDGVLTVGSVTPEPDRVKSEGRMVEVRFDGGERVRLLVKRTDGGLWVRAEAKLRCDDQPDPSVNVPTTAERDDDDDRDDRCDRRGRGNGRDGNGRDRDRRDDRCDDTSSSVPNSSVPNSSVPNSSVPSTSAPSTSAPSTSTPDTSTPTESSAPSSSAPENTAPGTTEDDD